LRAVKHKKSRAENSCVTPSYRDVVAGDIAESRISSAFLYCASVFARDLDSGRIFSARARRTSRRAERDAARGGAYTQN